MTTNKIEKISETAHSNSISNFEYFYDSANKKEIIMSLSYFDGNLKLWEFMRWQCLINIKNQFYLYGYIYSACIFKENQSNFFVVSNWVDYDNNKSCNVDSIKVYEFNLREYKQIKIIDNSKYNTLLIKTFKDNYNNYIISSGKSEIRAYDYNKNELFKQYKDDNNSSIFSFTVYKGKENIKLIGSCDSFIGNYIKIWDFLSSDILNKIKIDSINIRGICLLNEKYSLIACGDNSIKIVELEKGLIIKSFKEHKNRVCCIKKIILPKYGKCFLSHGFDERIILWKLEIN